LAHLVPLVVLPHMALPSLHQAVGPGSPAGPNAWLQESFYATSRRRSRHNACSLGAPSDCTHAPSYQLLPTAEPEAQSTTLDSSDLSRRRSSRPKSRHFRSSVILDDSSYWERARNCLVVMLESLCFQSLMAFLIFANSVIIGFETDTPALPCWDYIENGFLLVFTLELVSRIAVSSVHEYFKYHDNPDIVWNLFDFFIVSLGVMDYIFTAFADKDAASNGFATLFRVVRLLRILRIFRIVRFLKQLYMLAYGFAEAATAVCWVTMLMTVVLYICSIIMVREYGQPADSDPHHDFFISHFGSIPLTMLTLFELMSAPDIVEFHGAIAEYPCIIVFLVAFVIFGSFGMIALLTGVISESMFEKNQLRMDEERSEREHKRKVFAKCADDLFDSIDTTGSGSVTRNQLISCIQNIAELFEANEVNFVSHDLENMLDCIDLDASGTIEKSEFTHGVLQLCEDIRPMSIMEVHFIVSKIASKVVAVDARLERLRCTVDEITLLHFDDAERAANLVTHMRELVDHVSDGDKTSSENSVKMQRYDRVLSELRDMVEELATQKSCEAGCLDFLSKQLHGHTISSLLPTKTELPMMHPWNQQMHGPNDTSSFLFSQDLSNVHVPAHPSCLNAETRLDRPGRPNSFVGQRSPAELQSCQPSLRKPLDLAMPGGMEDSHGSKVQAESRSACDVMKVEVMTSKDGVQSDGTPSLDLTQALRHLVEQQHAGEDQLESLAAQVQAIQNRECKASEGVDPAGQVRAARARSGILSQSASVDNVRLLATSQAAHITRIERQEATLIETHASLAALAGHVRSLVKLHEGARQKNEQSIA